MRFRFLLTVLLAVIVAGSNVEAQMMSHSTNDILALAGKKKKTTTTSKQKPAQRSYTTEMRAGLGFLVGFPLGDFNRNTYTGYGFNATGEYFLDPKLSVGLCAGYQSFKYDEIHVGKGHYSMIPILANASYYFMDGDFHPYGSLNAGIFMGRSKYDSIIEPSSYIDPVTQLFIHTPGGVKSLNTSKTSFGLAPVAGIVYKAADQIWLNCNLRYALIFTEKKNTSFIGINLGLCYSFGI